MPIYTDGYGGDVFTGEDCTIVSASDTNYGAVASFDLRAGVRKALIRFNLSAIPAGATCNSATLYLYHASAGGSTPGTMSIWQILSGNHGWVEGAGAPATAQAGECCWNWRAYPATAWAGSAGLATSGTDYAATAIGTIAHNSGDAVGTEYAISLNTAVIATWFGSNTDNHGLLITTDGSNMGSFGSAEHATTGYRPKLVVDYTEAGSGVSGSAAITFDAMVLSGAGAAVISGQAAVILDGMTLSGSGVVGSTPIVGSATITFDGMTVNGAGEVANTHVYTDGPGGDTFTGEDVMLVSGAPTIAFSTHNVYDVSTSRVFLQRFILSAIPAGATCISAVAHYVKASSVPNGTVNVTLYRISDANGDWVEGPTYGGLAAAGEPCWNAKAADGAGGVQTAWAGSAGLGTSGTDYDATPIGSFVIPANATAGDEYTAELDPAVVEGWFGQSTNNGILMKADAAAEYIGSAEHETTGFRPWLVVIYATAGVVGSLAVTFEAMAGSGAGEVAVTGQASVTLDGMSVSGAGFVGAVPVQGQAAITFEGMSADGDGTIEVHGQLEATLAGMSVLSAGAVAVMGTAGISLAGMSLVAVGWIDLQEQPTPAERIYLIGADTRAIVIAAEIRIVEVE